MGAFFSVWLSCSLLVLVQSVPEAVVTAPALLPREASIFGYYAYATDGDKTICEFNLQCLESTPKTYVHM